MIHKRLLDGENLKDLKLAIDSGLVKTLQEENLLPEFRINISDDGNSATLTTNYINSAMPCEWTYGMLIEAAICTLRVQKTADLFGFKLHDAHFQNVLFRNGRALFVDFDSLKPGKNKWGWAASGEYRSEIRRPINLVLNGYESLVRKALEHHESLARDRLWTIQHPLLFRVIRKLGIDRVIVITRERLALVGVFNIHNAIIHMADWSRENSKSMNSGNYRVIYRYSFFLKPLARMICLFIRIKPEREIKRLLKKSNTARWGSYWTRYYSRRQSDISEIFGNQRFEKIAAQVRSLEVRSVTDIGGNDGQLLYKLASNGILNNVCLIDADQVCVETGRQRFLHHRVNSVVGVVDLSCKLNPILGNPDRFKSDCALALAIMHHLVLRYRMTFDHALGMLFDMTGRYLLVEYMPLGLWDGEGASALPSSYTEANFVKSLEEYSRILNREDLDTNRVLFLCEKHPIVSTKS